MRMTNIESKAALTAQEVADILKIAKNTVYELVKRGEIKFYNVGRKFRFTSADVEEYINRSRRLVPVPGAATTTENDRPAERAMPRPEKESATRNFVIGGQDGLLDLLASYLTGHPWGQPVLRAHIGSYNGLIALYRGEVQVAATHLWDGDSGEYNLPYVRRLLPGVKTLVIRLAWRTQGLFVAKGNPLDIKSWHDFNRPGLTLINREKGAGARVLLDEHLRRMGLWGRTIRGYDNEAQSPHTVAAAVGRGEADVAVGHSKAADQMAGVDFIPLQQECYDLAIKKEDLNLPVIRALLEILRSEEFRLEFKPLSGYDLRDMGQVVAET